MGQRHYEAAGLLENGVQPDGGIATAPRERPLFSTVSFAVKGHCLTMWLYMYLIIGQMLVKNMLLICCFELLRTVCF